ncbi:MAG: hypothetical protein QXL15_02215 [Candidatus Korarchaeota archaeon]
MLCCVILLREKLRLINGLLKDLNVAPRPDALLPQKIISVPGITQHST